ncbi:MAG: hypothetical protein Q7K13_08615 [Polynucleobacter sp.]|uniref:hypothetical protein n=1 Tax=Polynucleobacter sp. TaxID=2029855 RepID=UPI0027220221|nr:hypothetical protein [Polynucleobacter sp.]MDO8714522.1 hypothetical protein [Polynucleobacter sp.]
MTQNLEQVYEQLSSLRADLEDLRKTYKGVSKNYLAALSTMSDLTISASEAAKRAAKSTEQSRIAALNAMTAAQDASAHPELLAITELAVNASVAAGLAAIESSAAAAAAAASAAAAHQAEESLLKASSEASSASQTAAEAAAEAVKLSLEAKKVVAGG